VDELDQTVEVFCSDLGVVRDDCREVASVLTASFS
jgi:hypothetical protein